MITLALISAATAFSQTYPSFGPEKDVTISGLTFDAMEPFISADGNYLFFNNLNDGINTKLFYATRVNDSTFSYAGELNGTNQTTPPHLDAVADMDSANHFYWTSTRNYPTELDNLFHGKFSSGSVSGTGRVRGDFNKGIPGWLVMDHGISYNGQFLYYNNARLNSATCTGPCETELGIAKRVNDSTFAKIPESDSILKYINDTSYIYYAPCISGDNLELYYTRYPKGAITASTPFQICVAVRNSDTAAFSVPIVLFFEPLTDLIEAPTLTTDQQIMYYHRKIPGSHKIVMRYRTSPVGIPDSMKNHLNFSIFPNPVKNTLNISTSTENYPFEVSIFAYSGKKILTSYNETVLNTESLSPGVYFLEIRSNGMRNMTKFVKTD